MPVGTELRDNEATKLGRLPNLTTLVRITDRFFLLRRGFSDLGLAEGAGKPLARHTCAGLRGQWIV